MKNIKNLSLGVALLSVMATLSGCSGNHVVYDNKYIVNEIINSKGHASLSLIQYNEGIILANNGISLLDKIDSLINERRDVIIKIDMDSDLKEIDLSDNILLNNIKIKYGGSDINISNRTESLRYKLTGYNTGKCFEGVEIDTELKYEDVLEELRGAAESYNVAAKRPGYKFESGSLIVTSDGENGREANTEKLENDFKELADKYESGKVTLEFKEVKPDLTREQIESVNTKISTFSTSFAPTATRGKNVSLAASRLNGHLLAPGETISVDKTILSRNAANGYEKAGSYSNGKTIMTYGGGVCQVSTTLYGAILRAGIIPVERNEHSMAVHYVPLGLDAAISEGYKDLKIKNTYDKPIYIVGGTSGGTLTFSIYGASDLTGGFTFKPVSTSSKNGLWADSWLVKYKDGQEVSREHLFESSYRPHS